MTSNLSINIKFSSTSISTKLHEDILNQVAIETDCLPKDLYFTIIGEGEELAKWGNFDLVNPFLHDVKNLPPPISTEPGKTSNIDLLNYKLNFKDNETSFLEYRVVIWNSVLKEIVGVDSLNFHPNRAPIKDVFITPPLPENKGKNDNVPSASVKKVFIRIELDERKVPSKSNFEEESIDDKDYNENTIYCHFIPSTEFRFLSLRSPGPFLHLTFYPNFNHEPFSMDKWLGSLSNEVKENMVNLDFSSDINLTEVQIAPCANKAKFDWTSTCLFNNDSIKGKSKTFLDYINENLMNIDEKNKYKYINRACIVEPLKEVSPVSIPVEGEYDTDTAFATSPTALITKSLNKTGVNDGGNLKINSDIKAAVGGKTMPIWTITFDISKLNGLMPIFSFIGLRNSNDDTLVHKGTFTIFPEMFANKDCKNTCGSMVIPLTSDDKSFYHPIFTTYNVLNRFKHDSNNYKSIRSFECRRNKIASPGSLIGHRGMGKTYTESEEILRNKSKLFGKKFAENSLESFNLAHKKGCNFVEFDVMLTKDLVPIVLHDPVLLSVSEDSAEKAYYNENGHLNLYYPDKLVKIDNDGKKEESAELFTFNEQGCLINENLIKSKFKILDYLHAPVHQLSKNQLNSLHLEALNSYDEKNYKLKNLIQKYWGKLLFFSSLLKSHTVVNNSGLPYSNDNVSSSGKKTRFDFNKYPTLQRYGKIICNKIPTLEEVFKNTQISLGFDIEVKFPFQPKSDHNLFLQRDFFEINNFVDKILEVVFKCVDDENKANNSDKSKVIKVKERSIVFSSFDPDICIALMVKQSRFHVLFLVDTSFEFPTKEVNEEKFDAKERDDLKDYRSWGFDCAVQFAKAQSFVGIVMNSSGLLAPSDLEKNSLDYGKPFLFSSEDKDNKVKRVDNEDFSKNWLFANRFFSKCRMSALRYLSSQELLGNQKERSIEKHESLLIWTYGGANDNKYWCDIQKNVLGVSGIITDSIDFISSFVKFDDKCKNSS